jgi:hypothetical protein
MEAVEAGQLDGARWRRRWLVADGGSGEVLLVGGYTGVRPKPKSEEKRVGRSSPERAGRRCLLVNFPRGAAEPDFGERALGRGGARGRGRVLRGG